MFTGLRCPFSRLLCWFRLRQFVFGAQSPRICSWFRLMYSCSRGRVAPVSLGRGLRLCLFAVAGVTGPWCSWFSHRAFLVFSGALAVLCPALFLRIPRGPAGPAQWLLFWRLRL